MKLGHPVDPEHIRQILFSCEGNLHLEIVAELGCGDYGCVFLTNKNTVIKVTKHHKEYLAARALQGIEHWGIPKILGIEVWADCHPFEDEIYVIHRDNINDLDCDPLWFEEVIGGLESELMEEFQEDRLAEDDIFDTLAELYSDYPGSLQDELIGEQIAELYVFLNKIDLWIDDVILENFGLREGKPVIRDLGALMIRN